MELIIISAVIIVISQSIKLLIYLAKGEKFSIGLLSWVYIWTGEFPSTHSAVLAGLVYTIGREDGFGLLFGFSCVVSGFFLYSLLEDKKRYKLKEEYFKNSKDEAILKIVSDKKLLRFNGHTITDIVGGIILGLVIVISMNMFIL